MGINKKIAPIIITGMHHSGIGLVAHYLKQQGLFLGSQLISTDINNPHGYLEDVDFEQFQSKILTDGYADCTKGWPDWGYCEKGSFNYHVYSHNMERAKGLLVKKNLETLPWGWVDSRTTLMLDFWESLNRDNRYLLIYRNPMEVKKSILNMDVEVFNKHPEYVWNIWKQYNESILKFYRENKEKCLLVCFDTFIQKPERLYDEIKNKWGVDLPNDNRNDYSFCARDINEGVNTFEELDNLKKDTDCVAIWNELNQLADISETHVPVKNTAAPSVSIIIATYNDAKLAENAIISVEQVTNINYEIIIVNDGSSLPENNKYLERIKKRGYTVIDQENGGPSSARNTGIKQAKADIILVLDSDNTITAEYFTKALKVLDEQPEVGVAYCSPRFAGNHNRLQVLPEFTIERLLSRNFIDICAFFRKEIWQQLGGFDDKAGFEDWDLWIGAYSKGWKFHHIKEYLFEYRIRENSVTASVSKPERRYEFTEYIISKHTELFNTYYKEVIANVNKEHAELTSACIQANTHLENIKAQINIPLAITEVPEGKLSRFKELLQKVKHILSSPTYAPEEKRKWLQRLKYLFSSRGVMLVRKFFKVLFKYAFILLEQQKVTILLGDKLIGQSKDRKYNYWLLKNAPREKDLLHYKETLSLLSRQPKISLVLPTYNTPVAYFSQMVESVKEQIYPNWELCIADDNSTSVELKKLIQEYAGNDERIKYVLRQEHGGISLCSNSALEIATGEYTGLLDPDDLLTADALYQVIFELNKHPETDLVYSDEDKIDNEGYLSEPHFKPDWCPDNLLTRNYITNLAVLRTRILKEINGFRVGYEGSQDLDLFLRFTEKTDKIKHIPKILYHHRINNFALIKKDAALAGEKAIKEALDRRNQTGNVNTHNHPGFYNIRLDIKQKQKVSIIIPSKDKANILEVCLKSIYDKTTYEDFEIIMIDNNSSEESFFSLIKTYQKQDNFHYYKHDIPFNYAELMNYAVDKANGGYLLLLNNDTEVINGDWIECMVEHIQRNEIGVVGAKLLYPNDTIQHAGVIIGLNGLAGHTFVGEHRNSNGYFNYLNVASNYSAVTGACMMFRRGVYDEVGGFDEKFAVEYNDIDFCLKVKDRGYHNLYLPNVILYHHESISRGNPLLNKKSTERHIYEVDRFKSKWQKYIDHDPCYSPNLTKERANFEVGV